ncbi:eev maturation protein [Pteropox virus]|uniref:Eev maturation protein n=1 Tax=Pteropox virus TaxID=1873698 RepID=A0A1B1MRA1_9POXV|nr:eev maturation protein [Pteropox virus]ANS71104.1 eev maturation protein [Pteropox virus]
MFNIFGKMCNSAPATQDSIKAIEHLLLVHANSAVVARTRSGKGLLITRQNLQLAKITFRHTSIDVVLTVFLDFCDDEIIDPPEAAHTMHEVDTETFYSPKPSESPLSDILFKRADTCMDLLRTIYLHWPTEGIHTFSDINYWLSTVGMYDYRLVHFRDIRKRKNSSTNLTIIDDMVIGLVGYHAIWVKNLNKYNRPELDVMKYDLSLIASKNMWTKYMRTFNSSKMYAMCTTIALNGKSVIPVNISMYPGPTFTASSPTDNIIIDFLDWLTDANSSCTNITIVGFMSNFLESILIQKEVKKSSDWTLIGDKTIMSDKGNTVTFFDVSQFALGLSFSDYCKFWGGVSSSLPADLLSFSDFQKSVDSTIDTANSASMSLYETVTQQQVLLSKILPIGNVEQFNSIENMFITNAAVLGCSEHNGLYYPVHETAKEFIADTIHTSIIKSKTPVVHKNTRRVAIKNLLNAISEYQYPLGKPTYVTVPEKEKMYIALCEVKTLSKLMIPIIEPPNGNFDAPFCVPLTSVDIATITRVGGYKIRILGALQWESSDKVIFSGLEKITSSVKQFDSKQTSEMFKKMSASVDLLLNDCVLESSPESLVMLAFAVSYCRAKVHTAIERIDNHFSAKLVDQHDFASVWIREPAETASEIVKIAFC